MTSGDIGFKRVYMNLNDDTYECVCGCAHGSECDVQSSPTVLCVL